MSSRFKKVFFGISLVLFSNLQAQDFHLTQIDRSLPYLNPAFVGAYKGYERISLLNRNQWIGTGTQFLTSYGMAEFTPGRNLAKDRAYVGIAPSFSNDVGGDHGAGVAANDDAGSTATCGADGDMNDNM